MPHENQFSKLYYILRPVVPRTNCFSFLNMLALDYTSPNDFTRKMRAQTT